MPTPSTVRPLVLGLLVATIVSTTVWAQAQDERPNIVLMIADDMAWNDCLVYGHPTIQTPNLARLASEGLTFDRAFLTTSSCSPSRASIITGRYPHAADAEELHWPVPAEQVTFVEALKAAGYHTAAAGKWHLGNALKERFDEVRGADPSGFQLPTGPDAGNALLAIEGDGARQSGCGQWIPTLRERPRDKPFFLWLAAVDPHRDYRDGIIPEPHRPEDAIVPPFLPNTPEVRRDLARYYDEIGRLDAFVGLVLDELDAQGIADNTLVIFISDNGRPFPRCKTTIYDSGVKTPMIARWPQRITPETRTGALVSTVDFAPTLLSLAGLEPLDSFQGVDFSPIFDDPQARVRDAVYSERNWHDYAARARAVRTERFRYIRNEDQDFPLTPPADAVRSPTFREMLRLRDLGQLTLAQRDCFLTDRPFEELYDLETDPYELHNIVGDPRYARVLEDLRDQLDAWKRRTDDVERPLSPDEFNRETGEPLPNRVRPRPSKADIQAQNASR